MQVPPLKSILPLPVLLALSAAACKSRDADSVSGTLGMYDCDDCPAYTEDEGREANMFLASVFEPYPIPEHGTFETVKKENEFFADLDKIRARCVVTYALTATEQFLRRDRLYQLQLSIAYRADVGVSAAPIETRWSRIFLPPKFEYRIRSPYREDNEYYRWVREIQGTVRFLIHVRAVREICYEKEREENLTSPPGQP